MTDSDRPSIEDGVMQITETKADGEKLEYTLKKIIQGEGKKIVFWRNPTISAKAEPRQEPCQCLARLSATVGGSEFIISVPAGQEVREEILSRLYSTTCSQCQQQYLVAKWDDLYTGLLLK